MSSATVSLPSTALNALDATNLTSGTVPNARLSGITTDKLDLISTASVPSITAKGTPSVSDGYIQLNCEQNSHGIKIKSAPHSAGASYTLVMPDAIGTSNQVLRMNSGATALEFGTASGGKVLQVLTVTDNTQRSTNSTSFVTASSTLTLAITPASVSNKILILAQANVCGIRSNTTAFGTIFKDGTNLAGTNGFFAFDGVHPSYIYLDSPSTTSATTYDIRIRMDTTAAYIAYQNTLASLTLMEIQG